LSWPFSLKIPNKHGKLAPIDWVDAQKQMTCGPSSALVHAIENGHWDLFRTLVERKTSHMTFTCNKNVFGAIVLTGNIDMLEWYVNGNHPTSIVNSYAVDNGSLNVLDWLHTHHFLTDKLLYKASSRDSKRWDIFKWGIIHGYRIQKIGKYYFRDEYNASSSEDDSPRHRNSHRAALYALRKKAMTCTTLAEHKQWEILKFAHEKLQCEMDTHIFREIAKYGDFSLMEWAHQHKCPWDAKTCAKLARRGDASMLQWAHENGCPWDSETCAEIAKHNNLPLLQWVREKGCPWDGRVCVNAAIVNNSAVLDWAIKNGCDRSEYDENENECIERAERRCSPEHNPYFDDDNWRQRRDDDSDEARRQD